MNLTHACHAHLRKHLRPRRLQDAKLAAAISEEFAASRHTYGSPRLVHALRARGLSLGKNRVSRLMRQQQLRVRQKRRFVPRTTVVDKTAPVVPNRLLQHPAPTRPDQVWLTDITYLPTQEGWLYLAAEMDLCSRRIIGWSTHDTLATDLPLAALQRAVNSRGPHLPDLLHHSARGCQYTSDDFRRSLQMRSITASMSRKANCYDNAAMESFWATLKAECFGGCIPATRTLAHAMVFDYIETFYNEQSLPNNGPYFWRPRFRRKIKGLRPLTFLCQGEDDSFAAFLMACPRTSSRPLPDEDSPSLLVLPSPRSPRLAATWAGL